MTRGRQSGRTRRRALLRPPEGSISPTMPFLSATARRSCRTKKTTTPWSRSLTRQDEQCSLTVTPGRPGRRLVTSTPPMTLTCSATGTSRWRTPGTAGYWCWTRRRRPRSARSGRSVACTHNPPNGLGSPNGDTPLSDGDLLISEINGSWVDEYTTSGGLVWAVKLPIGYPSDPQQIGPDRYLVADYESPGAIVEFNRSGQVLYRYQPKAGPGELNHPSLVELLPSGVFMLNDDYNDRMVAIDPSTGALVWQYGQPGVAGTAPGLLNTPDGFDILGPGGTTPTHPSTG